MKLYEITFGYECCIVIAETSERARELAINRCGNSSAIIVTELTSNLESEFCVQVYGD